MNLSLPADQIDIRADARAVDEATVNGLAESIGTVGLINPIRVRSIGDRWEVIAGVHRLMACRALGLVEIECAIVTDDDLHAELAMIDENLCRAELSPSERAQQTARRKAIYLELHPETSHGGDRKSDQVDNLSTRSFAKETASLTGTDARTVRRDAERGEKVIDAAINLIRGTQLDTGIYLDKLKKLSPSEQVVAAKRDLAFIRQQERERAKGGLARRIVKIADEPLTDEEAAERQYAALVSAWNKAGEVARQRFRELIDTPVMDRRFA
jgi:ParB-like chromosome segregation protein Spo0J